MNVKRVLTLFSKETELFAGEIDLKNIKLSELRELFHITSSSEDYLMYGCYPVTKKELYFFEKRLNVNLNLSKYDYFVECYRDDEKI